MQNAREMKSLSKTKVNQDSEKIKILDKVARNNTSKQGIVG
jgi:hypothetical protein